MRSTIIPRKNIQDSCLRQRNRRAAHISAAEGCLYEKKNTRFTLFLVSRVFFRYSGSTERRSAGKFCVYPFLKAFFGGISTEEGLGKGYYDFYRDI